MSASIIKTITNSFKYQLACRFEVLLFLQSSVCKVFEMFCANKVSQACFLRGWAKRRLLLEATSLCVKSK